MLARDSDLVELDGPPAFDYGEKVVSRKNVRNDGTFGGKELGDLLVKKGDVGYVKSIGSFLQQFYIYGIDFVDRGYVVGMKGRELRSLDRIAADDVDAPGEAIGGLAESMEATA
ncbi:nitrogen fixation protein NifZ [Aromatoleum toluvorans]|uniref:Nitrogen fixation protein NifZ n=1 Tax=Aromatoleum toluvorans TaxID=92002 RepID=A0ABX1Q267_9RHOO|nr:nitrogen fixation protein NifZ [Aromatoleum toluvorans]NMG44451.1 nitrogen fixation protein NifZ [Aromatoleum toluvorans]